MAHVSRHVFSFPYGIFPSKCNFLESGKEGLRAVHISCQPNHPELAPTRLKNRPSLCISYSMMGIEVHKKIRLREPSNHDSSHTSKHQQKASVTGCICICVWTKQYTPRQPHNAKNKQAACRGTEHGRPPPRPTSANPYHCSKPHQFARPTPRHFGKPKQVVNRVDHT